MRTSPRAGRGRGRRRVPALARSGFWAASIVAFGACGAPPSRSDLQPEGPPEVLQVFTLERDPALGARLMLAYGSHPDWTEFNEGDDGVSTAAVAGGARVNLVVDELLRGTMIEWFVCACAPGCPGTVQAAAEQSGCGDDPATAPDETGRFRDGNFDG